MKCDCGARSLVLSTRKRVNGTLIRRRECTKGHRFTTEEIVIQRQDSPSGRQTSRSSSETK